MTVRVTESAPCQQALKISLAAEAVHPVREDVVREFQKEAAIAGFRKGKAPRDLVERQFPTEIRDETLRRLTRQVFEQVTTERKLKPVGPFEVTKVEFDEERGLELEAQVEVEPEFPVANYRGIPLKKSAVVIEAEQVDRALARLQESMAQLVPAGEGQPKTKQVPALDDELAKDAGFENLRQLRSHIEARVREQRQAEQAQRLEQALCDALLERHHFDVPARLVSRQTERLTRDFQVRLLLNGVPEAEVKQAMANYQAQLQTNAVRLVKLAFILERIAEKETISVTQDAVVDRLWKLAKQWRQDPAEVQRLLDAKGLWPSVLSAIRQDKTVQFLLSVAHIEEEQSSQ